MRKRGPDIGERYVYWSYVQSQIEEEFNRQRRRQAAAILSGVVGVFVEPYDWFLTGLEILKDPSNPLSYAGLLPKLSVGGVKALRRVETIGWVEKGANPLIKTMKGTAKDAENLFFELAEGAVEHVDPRYYANGGIMEAVFPDGTRIGYRIAKVGTGVIDFDSPVFSGIKRIHFREP